MPKPGDLGFEIIDKLCLKNKGMYMCHIDAMVMTVAWKPMEM